MITTRRSATAISTQRSHHRRRRRPTRGPASGTAGSTRVASSCADMQPHDDAPPRYPLRTMAFSSEATEAAIAWRDRALRRSLDPAATRSMARLERLLDAVREITNESEDASFTVAEVAARAGVSLKSFYRSFEGK